MKILVLTSRFPYPLEKGDKLRIYHQIRELAALHHQIILCSLSDTTVEAEDIAALKPFCAEIHILPLSFWGLPFRILKAFLQQKAIQANYFFSPKTQQQLSQIIAKTKPDHIYCQLVRMSEYVKNIQHIPKTLDYMDCLSLGMQRRAAASGLIKKCFFHLEAKRLLQYEQTIYPFFQNTIIISEQDRQALQIPNNTITLVSNGVDTRYFFPNPNQAPLYDLVFVGNMGYYPNVEAAKFLAQKILPLLIQQYPEIRVLIAGARPHAEVRALHNGKEITVSGWVADIRTAYQSASVMVAPLFHGSGQQNKILEAMAMFLPSVTTPIVNNAIEAAEGEQILVGKDEQELTKKILFLLKNKEKRKEIAQNARTFVQENYSWQAAVERLEKLIIGK